MVFPFLPLVRLTLLRLIARVSGWTTRTVGGLWPTRGVLPMRWLTLVRLLIRSGRRSSLEVARPLCVRRRRFRVSQRCPTRIIRILLQGTAMSFRLREVRRKLFQKVGIFPQEKRLLIRTILVLLKVIRNFMGRILRSQVRTRRLRMSRWLRMVGNVHRRLGARVFLPFGSTTQ